MSGAEDILQREAERGRIVEVGEPRLFAHDCGYLPDLTAVTEARYFASMSERGYVAALRAGYRRFGDLFFRPRCVGCNQCISYRVVAAEFRYTRRWRRVLKQNWDVRVEVGPVRADAAAVDMANAFYAHRVRLKGWPETRYTQETYARQFLHGPVPALEARFFRGRELLGIGLFDDLLDGESAVIFHYRASWSPQSPGTFNILWLIERARRRGLQHVYLGFWVPRSASTAYKAQFRPGEYLHARRWRRLDDDAAVDASPIPPVAPVWSR